MHAHHAVTSRVTAALLTSLLVGCSDAGSPGSLHPPPDERSEWTELHSGGVPGRDSPAGGEDNAATLDPSRNRVLVYGGKDDDEKNTNELWAFDVSTRRWSLVDAGGAAPPPREDHSLVLDSANQSLILYGGEDGPVSNATWRFDLTTDRWEDITHESAPPLQDHAAVYDPRGRRMLVFGGNNKGIMDSVTWAMDLDAEGDGYGTWSQLETSEPRPAPRRGHGGVYDPVRHRLIVAAGRQRSDTSYHGDVWALELDTGTWREIVTEGPSPEPVRQPIVGYDPEADELTLFGGKALYFYDDEFGHMLDARVWVLDLAAGRWTDRTPYPPAVYDHVGLYVPELGGVFMFGGSADRDHKEHRTWLLRHPRSPAPQRGGSEDPR